MAMAERTPTAADVMAAGAASPIPTLSALQWVGRSRYVEWLTRVPLDVSEWMGGQGRGD
jgi:hypothetical protein